MPVYFIAHHNGPVKIGYAKDPYRRLKSLQTGHPDLLKIQAIAPGGLKEEAAYHRRFDRHRRTGEWFTRAPEIVEEMRRLKLAGYMFSDWSKL